MLREKLKLKEDFEKMREKKYLKNLKLISHDPPHSKYFEMFPVKPGIHFFKALT